MKYLLIALAISIGWHIGKLLFQIISHITFEWYTTKQRNKEKNKEYKN